MTSVSARGQRARLAAALLLAAATHVAFGGAWHAAAEAWHAVVGLHAAGGGGHEAGADPHAGHGHDHGPAPSAVQVGCPTDCSDPGHAHRSHDHATCQTCRVLAAALLRPETAPLETPAGLALVLERLRSLQVSRAISLPASRGPPARA